MGALFCLAAVASALAFGALAFFWADAFRARAKARGGNRGRDLGLASTGAMAWVIARTREETIRLEASGGRGLLCRGALRRRSGWMKRAAELSGLSGRVSVDAMCAVRAQLAIAGGVLGAVVGAALSNELSALLGLGGALAGGGSVSRAFKGEAASRARELERSLPEMLEVIALGLRSGLSFERSFELYYRHFDGRLSQAAASAHRRWRLGFATREQALRDMAASYDSKLLSRLVESVVRSLRFGSSLEDGLESLAEEAREERRVRLQEAIAKAPVKMMVPTGTLILPAMLILVLGPVLLELMQGF